MEGDGIAKEMVARRAREMKRETEWWFWEENKGMQAMAGQMRRWRWETSTPKVLDLYSMRHKQLLFHWTFSRNRTKHWNWRYSSWARELGYVLDSHAHLQHFRIHACRFISRLLYALLYNIYFQLSCSSYLRCNHKKCLQYSQSALGWIINSSIANTSLNRFYKHLYKLRTTTLPCQNFISIPM